MPEKSIKGLFLDICHHAEWSGYVLVGGLSSIRRKPTDPAMRPGYFYNNLPKEVKERLKNELKSEHVQDMLLSTKLYGPVEPWWDRKSDWHKREMLKFEEELMKHGWKPNFSL